MSTQQESAIPFGIAHEQQPFRLVELPEPLLEFLTSPNAPALSIKSAPAPAPDDKSTKPAHAVICTPDKTFNLRQVQTSNSVFVLQPFVLPGEQDSASRSDGVRAVATCSSTLEVMPLSNPPSAENLLLPHLAAYNSGVDYDLPQHHEMLSTGTNKAGTFSMIPLSDGECERAWVNLCAFQLGSTCFRSAPQTLLKLWDACIAASFTEDLDLRSRFLIDELSKGVSHGEFRRELVEAVCRRLLPIDEEFDGQWAVFDKSKSVAWVGKLLLETQPLRGVQLLELWHNHLPNWKDWVAEARLEDLDGGGVENITSNSANTMPAKAATRGRKWHEKFKQQRR